MQKGAAVWLRPFAFIYDRNLPLIYCLPQSPIEMA